MNNHQSEIADALADQNYIVKATVSSVLDCVDAVLKDQKKVRPYPEKQDGVIVDLIE